MTANLKVSSNAYQEMLQSDWSTTLKIIADETGCSPVTNAEFSALELDMKLS